MEAFCERGKMLRCSLNGSVRQIDGRKSSHAAKLNASNFNNRFEAVIIIIMYFMMHFQFVRFVREMHSPVSTPSRFIHFAFRVGGIFYIRFSMHIHDFASNNKIGHSNILAQKVFLFFFCCST